MALGGFIFNLETPDTQRGLEEREAAEEYRIQGTRMKGGSVAVRQTDPTRKEKKTAFMKGVIGKPVCGLCTLT